MRKEIGVEKAGFKNLVPLEKERGRTTIERKVEIKKQIDKRKETEKNREYKKVRTDM